MAYITAVTHNIQEMALPLKQSLTTEFPLFKHKAVTLIPPKPLIPDLESSKITQMNWPHHSVAEEDLLQTKEEDEETKIKEVIEERNELDIEINTNNEVEEIHHSPNEEKNNDLEEEEEEVKDNWGIDDLELPEEPAKPVTQAKPQIKDTEPVVLPLTDKLLETVKYSNKIGDLVACGFFEQAMEALRKQIGVNKFEPFKQIFLDIYMGSSVLLSSVPFTSPLELRLLDDKREFAPLSFVNMSFIENELKAAYKLTTEGTFNEAISRFRRILLLIPMMTIQKIKEKEDVLLLIRICLEYIVGLRCEVSRKQINVDFLFYLYIH